MKELFYIFLSVRGNMDGLPHRHFVGKNPTRNLLSNEVAFQVIEVKRKGNGSATVLMEKYQSALMDKFQSADMIEIDSSELRHVTKSPNALWILAHK